MLVHLSRSARRAYATISLPRPLPPPKTKPNIPADKTVTKATIIRPTKPHIDLKSLRPPKYPSIASHFFSPSIPRDEEQMHNELPAITKRMRNLLSSDELLAAAGLFESHCNSHPALRLDEEALLLAVTIYGELKRIAHCEDIIDFIEENHIHAPQVYHQMLTIYINNNNLEDAEAFVIRMKKQNCELSSALYSKLALLYYEHDRETEIMSVLQEVQLWYPEEAHLIQSVLVKLYLKQFRIEEAQQLMREMYLSGAPFHRSVFAALFNARLSMGIPDAVVTTLKEMRAMGVDTTEEFCLSVVKSFLERQEPELAENFVKALYHSHHRRFACLYHRIIQFYYHQCLDYKALNVYRTLRMDTGVSLDQYSFMRIIPSLSRLHRNGRDINDPLLMVYGDMLESSATPLPMSIGYMLDLLEHDHPDLALNLAKTAFQKMMSGEWTTNPGTVNATAYGMYHFGTEEDRIEFVNFVISHRLIPTTHVVSIVLRHMTMRRNSEDGSPEMCAFDLEQFIGLMQEHAYHLELPAPLVERFTAALMRRGMDIHASAIFSAAMQSLRPVEHDQFNNYRIIIQRRRRWDPTFSVPSLHAKESTTKTVSQIDEPSESEPEVVSREISSSSNSTETTQIYSGQYESHPTEYQYEEEYDPNADPKQKARTSKKGTDESKSKNTVSM